MLYLPENTENEIRITVIQVVDIEIVYCVAIFVRCCRCTSFLTTWQLRG